MDTTPKAIERVVRWDAHTAKVKRKGQRCTVLAEGFGRACVRYEDGTEAVVPRMSLTTTGIVPAYREKSERVKAIDSKPQK
jgi:hypothetical protein